MMPQQFVIFLHAHFGAPVNQKLSTTAMQLDRTQLAGVRPHRLVATNGASTAARTSCAAEARLTRRGVSPAVRRKMVPPLARILV